MDLRTERAASSRFVEAETPGFRTLAAASVGNLCEIYDFAIFAFSVPILSTRFFPNVDPVAALLNTLALYGVAYVARPFGGIIFGLLADRLGRIRVLTASIWLMAGGTMAIGLLPTYATIGVAAPALLAVCRCLQGVAMGGETTGNSAFALESAPPGRRGRWIGWTWFFGYGANAIAALLITLLQFAGGSEAYGDWLWRLPFLTGGLIGVVGFWLRRALDDPAEYKAVAAAKAAVDAGEIVAVGPLRAVGRLGRAAVVRVILIQSTLAVGANVMLGFFYPYLIRVGRLAAPEALFTNAAAILVLAAAMPVSGALSDRFGRRPVLACGSLAVAAAAYPALMLAASGGVASALAGQVLIAVGVGLYGGAAFTVMPELFPTAYRATGHAVSYNVGTVIFGGTAPFVTTWLEREHGALGPAAYLIAIGLIGAATAVAIPESFRSQLRSSVGQG